MPDLFHVCFYIQDEIRSHSRITIDFTQLCEEIPVAEFASVLHTDAPTVLSSLGLACHHALLALRTPFPIGTLTVRLRNYKPITALKNLKSNFVDKFIALRGNVVRVSNIKPLVTSMAFKCVRCGNEIVRTFVDGKYNPPSSCEGKCKNKIFAPNRDKATAIDWQKIRIQEIVG